MYTNLRKTSSWDSCTSATIATSGKQGRTDLVLAVLESEMAKKRRFVIWAPNYNEQEGGSLVLHYLCHYLNAAGWDAFLWHKSKCLRKDLRSWSTRQAYLRKKLKRILRGVRPASPSLLTPVAREKHLEGAIVVYPEKVDGNPLCSARVVRWFLHKPGFHTGQVNYGENELYFYYQKAFNDHTLGKRTNSELYFPVVLEHVFKQVNFGARAGTCYILRKGKDRPIQHDLRNGVVIDNMSNTEIARVFNQVEFCVSYDLYTFYSQYAAVCGCKSIVVPEPGLTKESWQPKAELRYGVAYGEEDLEWAVNTRCKLLEALQQQQQQAIAVVNRFAEKCCRFFCWGGDCH